MTKGSQVAPVLERLRRAPAPARSEDTTALPEPVRRYLARALGADGPTASGVRLHMRGSVLQNGRRLPIEATEILVPGHGFHWRARARVGPLVVTVTDHYYRGDSRVAVRAFGLVPMGGEQGADTVASSRGRLAAESIWAPQMLQPRPGVRWSALDDDAAVVHLDIDGVEESLTLRVDADGRLAELRMQRWGNVGVSEHAALPYGFDVRASTTFSGCTIPSDLVGGWWYGTERYREDQASRFTVERAEFA